MKQLRSIGCYHFEGGGLVEIRVTGDVATEDALDMVEDLVAFKRKELAQRKVALAGVPRSRIASPEESYCTAAEAVREEAVLTSESARYNSADGSGTQPPIPAPAPGGTE